MTMVSEFPAISPVQRGEPGDDREPVHLVHVSGRPPPGGGICQCIRCGIHFHSRNATWTTDRQKHDDNTFTGKFKSCTPVCEKNGGQSHG